MAKPKAFDTWPAEKQEEWRDKVREQSRKHYEANAGKVRERIRKYREANADKVRERKRKHRAIARTQSAADQFFILAAASEQLSKLEPK